MPFNLIIIRENFLQKGLLGKFYKEKLEIFQNYQGKVSYYVAKYSPLLVGSLFGGLLFNTLPVLAPVVDGSCHLPRVALEHVSLL